jgi:hypothetical protein
MLLNFYPHVPESLFSFLKSSKGYYFLRIKESCDLFVDFYFNS